MKSKEQQELDNSLALTDVLIRVHALETLLIEKGILNKDDLSVLVEKLSEQFTRSMLKSAGIDGIDADNFILQMKNKNVDVS